MRKLLKIPVIWLLKKLDLYSLYSLRINGAVRESGWFRTFREKRSVDEAGNPIPWFTYPAIEFISRRVRPDMKVFEYGSGASTLWWAQRVDAVVACEHDELWYRRVAELVPDNVRLRHIPLAYDGGYCRAVAEYRGEFDVVALDGRDRVNCAIHALEALKPDGVIIWDNSDRPEYQPGYDLLFSKGFRRIEFAGLAPIDTVHTETSIFYRPDNCLGI